MNPTPVTILHVEDDEFYQITLARALEKQKVINKIVVANDGQEALDILRGENGRDKIESPCIVLLDLSMPKMDGLEFLDIVRNDEVLKNTYIIVLSSSKEDEQITEAYRHCIAGYVPKDQVGTNFSNITKLIDALYITVCIP